MKLRFFITDVTYRIVEDRAFVYLFGRAKDGRQVCVVDKGFEPYIYARIDKDDKKFDDVFSVISVEDNGLHRVTRVERVRLKWMGRPQLFLKVFFNTPKAVPKLRDVVREIPGVVGIHEFDILFVRRYLIDKGLIPMTLVEAECSPSVENMRVETFELKSIRPVGDETFTSPKMVAVDIEVYNPEGKQVSPDRHPIVMLSLHGDGINKVLTWKRFSTNDRTIEFVDGEAELLQRFGELIKGLSPDFILGYYSDGFDFPFIRKRARRHKIKLDLGLDYSELNVRGRNAVVSEITGIPHIDVCRFVQRIIGRVMKTDVYTLDAVAEELMGVNKIEVDIERLAAEWDAGSEALGEFCKYCLHDARITYDLAKYLFPNMLELVKVVGLPVFDTTRSSMSQFVEWYIIRQASVVGEVCPNKPGYQTERARAHERAKGALVYTPKPGLYDNVVVFDYRSLYPSIMASHNISPDTYRCRCCEGEGKVPLEGANHWFCTKKKGFISSIIEDVIQRRARVKELLREKKDVLLEARSQALKVLANSFYGYTGFAPARWYCFECQESITAWGRHHIQDVLDKAKSEGLRVLYSDSLPFDRRVFIRDSKGDIRIVKIGELYFRKGKHETLAYKDGKTEFMPIRRVIRHPMKKNDKLLKFVTPYGTTVITAQHSVYSYREGEIKLVDAGKLKKGDNLISLTNPIINVKYEKGHVFDIAELDLGNYAKDIMLYRDDFEFPARQGVCPYCSKVVCLSSHVHAKHQDRRRRLSKKSPYMFIGGKNAKTGKIPRFWELDEDMAWLIGFYCADGSVSSLPTKSGRKTILSFGGQNLQTIKKVKNILDGRLGADLKIIESIDRRTGNKMYYYRVQRIPIVALFQNGFSAGKTSEFKQVPWFIFNSEECLRRSFLEGYLIGDGQHHKDKRYATKFIRFSTKSKELAIGLQMLFKSLYHGRNAWGKEMCHVAWDYRRDKPKISNLRVQSSKGCKGDFCLAKIKEIKKMPREKYVYDLEVAGSHNFVDAEGMILVHNTDSVFLLLGKKTKDDAMKFVERINANLPGLMELEYENTYKTGLFVPLKASEAGAKKKYALLSESGELKITGFATVRRNVSPIAKRVQREVLEIILKEKDVDKAKNYVSGVVKQLKAHEVRVEDVTLFTKLQKDIEKYAAVGPHVAAAKRMKERGMPVARGTPLYYVIVKGKGRIRDKVRLPDEITKDDYDPEYYIHNQILPAVDRIFAVFNISEGDIEGTPQKTLGAF